MYHMVTQIKEVLDISWMLLLPFMFRFRTCPWYHSLHTYLCVNLYVSIKVQKLLSIQIIPISFLFVEITYILRWNLFCKPLMAFLSHGHEQTLTYKVTSILVLEAALLKALYYWSFSVSRALHWEEILWISKNMTILVYRLFLPFRPISN